jgi:hypothetical protein
VPYTLSTAWIKPGKTQKLRDWYAELDRRRDEAIQTLDNEGIRQEIAFILPQPDRDLLAVFIQVDDMEAADAAFFSSSHKIDSEHKQVMDECTEGGAAGRLHADFMYSLINPPETAGVKS